MMSLEDSIQDADDDHDDDAHLVILFVQQNQGGGRES